MLHPHSKCSQESCKARWRGAWKKRSTITQAGNETDYKLLIDVSPETFGISTHHSG